MSEELKPCPFCGGLPDKTPQSVGYARNEEFCIWCQPCLVEGPHKHNEQEAIKAWNTRAKTDAIKSVEASRGDKEDTDIIKLRDELATLSLIRSVEKMPLPDWKQQSNDLLLAFQTDVAAKARLEALEEAADECIRIFREAPNEKTDSVHTSFIQNKISHGCIASEKAIIALISKEPA